MRISRPRRSWRGLGAALLAFVPVVAFAAPAHAATRIISYQCRGETPLGSVIGVAYQDVLDVVAPATVAPRGTMTIRINPRVNRMLTHIDNRPVESVRNISFKILLPTNSGYLSTTLSGGSGIGEMTVSRESNALLFTIAGSISGGAQFELPTISITVRASRSGNIRLRLAGYSLANPNLSFTARVRGNTVTADVPTACYASPDVTLSTTQIT